jgi:hypothetical protein
MKLQPMNDPRPGQQVQCIHCHKMIDADEAICDLDGVPFKAYYHDACLSEVVSSFLWWVFVEERGGYFFWKYEETPHNPVYQCTQTPEPPTNEAGYYSYGYLLKVKGLLNGPTASSILQEWAKREER